MNATIGSLWRSQQFKRSPMFHEEIHKAEVQGQLSIVTDVLDELFVKKYCLIFISYALCCRWYRPSDNSIVSSRFRMTVLTAIRQERHSTPRLSVIVFAWLSMLVSSCSMSLMPVGLGGDTVTGSFAFMNIIPTTNQRN